MDGIGLCALKVLEAGSNFRMDLRDLMSIDHPNLVRIYRCINDVKCAVALELCGNNLEQILHGDRDKLDSGCSGVAAEMNDRLRWGLNIAQGVEYLHNRQIMHRDIAAKNCFLSVGIENDSRLLAKLGDFITARFAEASEQVTAFRGSVTYMAPEMMASSGYGLSVDVYAMGILLHQFASAKQPYADYACPVQLTLAIYSGKKPDLDDLPSGLGSATEFEKLLQTCWDADPQLRPSASDLALRLRNIICSKTCVADDGEDAMRGR
jgi:serine/threonine protein kinase